jgi:hypothetical protein
MNKKRLKRKRKEAMTEVFSPFLSEEKRERGKETEPRMIRRPRGWAGEGAGP